MQYSSNREISQRAQRFCSRRAVRANAVATVTVLVCPLFYYRTIVLQLADRLEPSQTLRHPDLGLSESIMM